MKTWIIDGADKATGAEKRILITAETEAEATYKAGERGLFVSQVSTDVRAKPPTPQQHRPEYKDIVDGNRLIRFFGAISAGIGWFGLVGAALAFLTGVVGISTTQDRMQRNEILVICGSAIGSGLSLALPAFIVAAILRMYASLAMAVRDIARNSF